MNEINDYLEKTESRLQTMDEPSLLIPTLSAGDKLYHYTTAEGLKGICEGEFWVTERSFLNDYDIGVKTPLL